jgi:glyoxylase-like metal-dependent hydrolase (beta-lactamase superfamily II)
LEYRDADIMTRRKKIILGILGGIAVVFAGAYYYLIVEAHVPDNCEFRLDMTELRTLAASIPGEKATELRVERIARFEMPEAVLVSGHPWSATEMIVFAYEMVFPSGSIVIDTALDEKQTAEMQGDQFDAEAFARVARAMHKASAIYVTHEHGDHLGGLIAQTSTVAFARAKITREQLSHPEVFAPFVITPEISAQLKPLEYDRVLAVAPGLVLIKTPGHTPGSQLLFLQMADGTELLILGDTAWKAVSVREATSPPRAVSLFFLRNDRELHTCQLAALRELGKTEPKLFQIPGHDAAVIDDLLAKGVLKARFR